MWVIQLRSAVKPVVIVIPYMAGSFLSAIATVYLMQT